MLTVLAGDALEQLRTLPDESVQCCVTSPPYWGLRDYSTNRQLGLEKTPEEYVAKMVEVFREVRRVLRKDGTLWLNLGDSYARAGGWSRGESGRAKSNIGNGTSQQLAAGLKEKDLCGIPWRVAFALQADGWWLRSDIIWAKPNPMPESVTDRPTKSHEYLFLLTKSASYFYDAEAIKEKATVGCLDSDFIPRSAKDLQATDGFGSATSASCNGRSGREITSRNKRSVWTVATAPYPEAHFATYPLDLIKPCIMAGTSAKGCCSKCGAPWDRMTGRECDPRHVEPSSLDRFGTGETGVHRKVGGQYQKWMEENPMKTLGWQPTCKCEYKLNDWMQHFGSIPCTVLDPFAGSGTTGAVALELGRKAVLIELNPKYFDLIRQRCNVTLGLQLA